ncbi:MAG: hypothetical protein LIP77_03480 [Planctomycetes bacterium]|nr:hypothetical protein [Planctomycetota bacterium]
MKHMRLAICVAAFAIVGGIAVSEDMDVRALQAQLAAQEARLNDLQAKVGAGKTNGGEPEGIVSLRKNAVVTLGGILNTRYFYRDGDIKSSLNTDGDIKSSLNTDQGNLAGVNDSRTKRFDAKNGDFRIADAKVEMKIDVNEYFDAYLKMDLHDGNGRDNVSGIAQNYWVRWKNVCNSGFGLLIGRDDLKFGDNSQARGILEGWNKEDYATSSDLWAGMNYATVFGADRGEGMFVMHSVAPAHTATNWTRTTQINPYWESQDGKLRFDLSLIQAVDRRLGTTGTATLTRDGYTKYRSINYGAGSGTARVIWKPIEGLKLTASAMNLHANNSYSRIFGLEGRRDGATGVRGSKNNSATNLAFLYRPCFFDKFSIWSQWTHDWDAGFVKDMDTDTVNYGIAYDFTDQFSWFAQGDFLRAKNKNAQVWYKATGWATYTGVTYTLPYGVNMELGWRHEEIKYKGRSGTDYSGTHTKYKGDSIYAHLGFNF